MNYTFKHIINILVIFLLLLFVASVKSYSQKKDNKKQVQQYEEQLLMQLGTNNYNLSNENGNSVSLPDEFSRNAELIDQKRKELTLEENHNYIQFFLNGNQNSARMKQKDGIGNIMELGIEGNNNTGDYLQKGNNNYLYDRIFGNGVDHKIHQYGNGLGIYNSGVQTLPLIIKQRGQNMKLELKSFPQ